MMRKVTSMAVAGLIAMGAFAQEKGNWCGSDAHLQELLNADPAQAAYYWQKTEEQIQRSMNGVAQRDGETIIIPTVVHVLYADCDASISVAQVKDGIRILNEDMQRLNADSTDTREIFKPHAGVTNVEFRLAQIDPNGNPTNGITRTLTSLALNAGESVKSLINWPTDQYFNIWVVENIAGGGPNSIILGYAQFPGSGSWNTYGILIRDDSFGSIGSANYDGRTLTHEVGHCLNLFHTFQSGCGSSCTSTGDRICDTPPVAQSSQPCDFSYNTCSNDAVSGSPYPSGTPDQIENYMSYNDCQNMFTNDQADRMLAVFTTHNTLANLVSEENLAATGVGGFLEANFATQLDVVVADRPMVFQDLTRYNAQEWSWDFGPGAFPPTSSEQNPTVTMVPTGLQDVSLTVGQNVSELSITKKVLVASREGQSVPFEEGFESVGSLPSLSFVADNQDDDENEFLVTSAAAYEGEQSLMLENAGTCERYTDALISQTMDFSPFDEVELSFKAAYARRSINSTDFLRVYISDDFGATWELAGIKGSTSLESVSSFQTGSWFPEGQSEWKEQTFTFFQNKHMKEGMIVKIEFGAEGGNNFFIDDIQFTGDFTGDLLLKNPKNGAAGLKSDVLLDWKAVGSADTYEYQVDKTESFDSESLITGSTTFINSSADNEDTEVLLEDLDLGATYFWRVRYDNNGTASEWSNTWSFTVSEDGLSVSEPEEDADWKVFPNPAENQFTVRSSSAQLKKVRLIDVSGRVVSQQITSPTTSTQVNVTNLDQGIYILQITEENGKQVTQPVMVR